MKNIIIICLFLFSANSLIAQQKISCNVPLRFDEYNLIFSYLNNNDTFIKSSKKNVIYHLHFFSCQGDIYFEMLDSNHNIQVAGTYCNSLDTLSGYMVAVNPEDPYDVKMEVEKYFLPLKSGIWIYYNAKNEIYKKELWYKGIKQ